jgi:hypothetical protein
VNTQFTLTDFQKKSGSITIGGLFDIEKVNNLGEGKLRVKFEGFGKDLEGRTFLKEKPVILIGTIEQLNVEFNKIGQEIYYNEKTRSYDLRQLPKKEEGKNDEK